MPKKPRYTPEQHDKLGAELHDMRDRLSSICVELAKHYPLKVFEAPVNSAINSIDKLRSNMDSQVFDEMKHLKDTNKKAAYYYRGVRKKHDH